MPARNKTRTDWWEVPFQCGRLPVSGRILALESATDAWRLDARDWPGTLGASLERGRLLVERAGAVQELVVLVAAVVRVDATEVAEVRVLVARLLLHPLLRLAVLVLPASATPSAALLSIEYLLSIYLCLLVYLDLSSGTGLPGAVPG